MRIILEIIVCLLFNRNFLIVIQFVSRNNKIFTISDVLQPKNGTLTLSAL